MSGVNTTARRTKIKITGAAEDKERGITHGVRGGGLGWE